MNSFKITIASLCCLFAILVITDSARAQTRKVTFNGVGRSIMYNDNLGGNLLDTDTTTIDKTFDGYVLFDIGINIRPNKVTYIDAILRIRNQFDSFFGSGVTIEVRKLYLEGLIKNRLRYQVGDFNFNLTPYTFYNPLEETVVNEASIFTDLKEINYYENFYAGETWRQQGFMTDFALTATRGIREIEFMGFISRTRTANFFAGPDRFYSGGHIAVDQSKYFNFGINAVNMFDVGSTFNTDQRFTNNVIAYNGELKNKFGNIELSLIGESGFSFINYRNDSLAPDPYSDFFYDIGIGADLGNGLTASLSYRDIGPEFESAGAQSRRIDYGRDASFFPELSNERINRELNLFDLNYDEDIYNEQISSDIDSFKRKYSNAEPNGVATSNRRGINVSVAYTDQNKQALVADLSYSFLSEIVGEGSSELRSFHLVRASVDFHLNKLIDYSKNLTLTGGLQVESTSRGGTEIEAVELNSQIVEVGIEAEVVPRLDVLFGGKLFFTKGNEYNTIRDRYNEVFQFKPVSMDESEQLIATGLRYRFNENIFITGQYINYQNKLDLNDALSFNINRFMLVYNMVF